MQITTQIRTVSPNVHRHLLGWFAMPLFAIANGLIRDSTYGESLGRDLSHSVSVIPLVLMIMAWSWYLARRRPLRSQTDAWFIGAMWLVLTLLFEFGFGYLQGLTFSTMLAQYDVTSGQLWPLVPLVVLFSPPVMVRFGARSLPNETRRWA